MASDLQALIFDVDGTLADTERDGHRVAFNRAFAEADLDWEWSPEFYGELLTVTGGKERIRHFLDCYRSDFRAEDLSRLIADLHQSKTRHYTELLGTGAIPLRPGVERLLTEARAAGLRLAIATTTTPENVSALLLNTLGPEALGWFEVIGAGDCVPAKKPAPDIYCWVLDRLGLAPESCLAFEDSQNGLRAALGAELRTVVSLSGYTVDEDFSGACLVVDQWGEPGSPCRVLAGRPRDVRLLDLATLRRVHAT